MMARSSDHFNPSFVAKNIMTLKLVKAAIPNMPDSRMLPWIIDGAIDRRE
jgi:hypothetical protein